MRPGHCRGKAHRREHLGYAGHRVLVSRKWSGKTLADRAWLLETLGLSATDPPAIPRSPSSPAIPTTCHQYSGCCSVALVADLMRELGLRACQRRAFRHITIPGEEPVVALTAQRFAASGQADGWPERHGRSQLPVFCSQFVVQLFELWSGTAGFEPATP
jgi:hypothetical protein